MKITCQLNYPISVHDYQSCVFKKKQKLKCSTSHSGRKWILKVADHLL